MFCSEQTTTIQIQVVSFITSQHVHFISIQAKPVGKITLSYTY